MTLRALVIEDNDRLHSVYTEILESLGHEYRIAACQADALENFSKESYSYVLLDLSIPYKKGGTDRLQNGFNLIKEIRHIEGPKTTPIIVVSASSDPCISAKSICWGANYFVSKSNMVDGKLDRAIYKVLRTKTPIQARSKSISFHIEGRGEFEFATKPTSKTKRQALQNNTNSISFVEKEDGWHWLINGHDKGSITKRKTSIVYKISQILYEQLGKGWVPHRTFMHAVGWSKEEYFGNSCGTPGRMQRQLSLLRKNQGLNILFHRDKGVQLSSSYNKTT